MGGTESSESVEKYEKEFLRYHSKIRSAEDERYGVIAIYRHLSSGDLVLVKERWCSTSPESEKATYEVNRVKAIKGYQITPLSYSHIVSENHTFSDFRKFYFAFKFHPLNFEEMILNN